MVEAPAPTGDVTLRPRAGRLTGRLAGRLALTAALTAGLGIAAYGGLRLSGENAPALRTESEQEVAALDPAADVEATQAGPIEAVGQVEPESLAVLREALLWSELPSLPPTHFAALEQPTADLPAASEQAAIVESPAVAAPLQTVPLPLPRPQFGNPVTQTPRRAERPSRRARVAVAPPPQEDTRSFFEKLLGMENKPAQPGPVLAYAALESSPSAIPSKPQLLPTPTPVPPSASGGTATYDITARSVTLPSGEKLEAHSGYGDLMDDPRYVHVPMRGATPPGTYDLTEREASFHGVRAIRMTPIGGPGAIYNRNGILAHTYMLRGQPGASNGCVVFANYDRFLQAYLRGEISRIVVVAGGSGGIGSLFAGTTRTRTAKAD